LSIVTQQKQINYKIISEQLICNLAYKEAMLNPSLDDFCTGSISINSVLLFQTKYWINYDLCKYFVNFNAF